MRAQNGFSIVELLISVAIICVLAAIAIPGLLRSHIAANESQAVASMRQVVVAQTAYAATYPAGGYASTLAQLGPPSAGGKVSAQAAGFIDSALGCAAQPCTHAGYAFEVTTPRLQPAPSYHLFGMPRHTGFTGSRGFCADQTHHLSYDPEGNTRCTEKME